MKLDEVISRIAVMEKASIVGNVLDKEQQRTSVKEEFQNQIDLFLKSNSVPRKNIDELKRFEGNLKDTAFFEATMRILIYKYIYFRLMCLHDIYA